MQEHIQLSLHGAYRSSNKVPESALQNYVFWKVRDRQNEGYPVGKRLLLKGETAGLGLDWKCWLIMGQAENSVDPSRRCPQQGRESLSRDFSATASCLYWISYFMVEDEEIENRRECGEDRTKKEGRAGQARKWEGEVGEGKEWDKRERIDFTHGTWELSSPTACLSQRKILS